MTTITFIKSPPYIVDFREFAPQSQKQEILALNQKVQRIALGSLQLIKHFFIALHEATYQTFSNAGISFKHIVLGYYGSLHNFRPPGDIYLAVFKVAYWILGMAWCLTTTTARLFVEKVSPTSNSSVLSNFSKDLNVAHIKTNELSMDVSGVPKEIKVDNLAEIFDQINFTHSELPGYMVSTSRQEGTEAQLKESLATFISNVNKRVAFLGTPPAYDTPRLMAFYQQIEDAVRLSIHKVNQNIADFEKSNGKDLTNYNEVQMRKYKDLLEAKARMAIDLAIAGLHCGARYMGESMSTYYSFYGDSIMSDKSLEDSLIELLAQRRREIAHSQILLHFGNDSQSTHKFNKYMVNLGGILGIPGSKNIVEHLDTHFNRDLYLKKFFEKYTVDKIITTIENEIKKSQTFREKITDWLKDQVREWKKDNEDSNKHIESIKEILKEKIDNPDAIANINNFQALVAHLKETKVALPPLDKGWDEFIQELFGLKVAQQWCQAQFPGNRMEYSQKIRSLKATCSEAMLGPELLDQLKNVVLNDVKLDLNKFIQKFSDIKKIEKIQKVIRLETATLERVLKNEADLNKVIHDYLDLDRHNKFLEMLNIENIATEGLSAALMEWLLVSQKILLPQLEEI